MKKNFLVKICMCFAFYCKGQELKLTFSPTITSSQDTSVKTIAHLWENYLNARYDDYLNLRKNAQYNRQTDSIQNLYWHSQSEDLFIGIIETYVPFSEFSTFSIRKYADAIYEIHTFVQVKTSEEIDRSFVYKVCATKTDNGFKLLNYFDVSKNALQNYTSENIEFYYPSGFDFDTEKVNDTEKFISQFRKDYNIKKINEKIICVNCNNINECNTFIGFDFTTATSANWCLAHSLAPKTILTSCQDAYIHEFVHILLQSSYPNINDILHEGIASFYGGMVGGTDYIFHAGNLQKYLSKNTIDFLDTSLLWNLRIENATLAYTVGALIIDYTLNNYGIQKVIELFSCKDYIDIFSKLEIPMENVNDFFIRLLNEKFE